MAKNGASFLPTDAVKRLLGQDVLIKCRNARQLNGTLHAYDEHLNMVLADVTELTPVEAKDAKPDPDAKLETTRRQMPMLYLRGDAVLMVCKKPSAHKQEEAGVVGGEWD